MKSMPPEIRGAGDPKEWLRRARSNLARARIGHGNEEEYKRALALGERALDWASEIVE